MPVVVPLCPSCKTPVEDVGESRALSKWNAGMVVLVSCLHCGVVLGVVPEPRPRG